MQLNCNAFKLIRRGRGFRTMMMAQSAQNQQQQQHANAARPRGGGGWRAVVTAFVQRRSDGRVLVVKRSDRVSTYQGMWGGVSGGLEAGDASLGDRALAEVEEEAGVPRGALRLRRVGRPLAVRDRGRRFLVHPFLFSALDDGGGGGGGGDGDGPEVTLNWENTEAAWVTPGELAALPHVPLLPETLARVAGPAPGSRAAEHLGRLEADRAHGAAELAGWVVDALEDAAANEPPPATCGARAALDFFQDYAWALACARPSMVPIASAAANVLDAALAALPGDRGGIGRLDAAAVCTAVRDAARAVRSEQRERARRLQRELAKLPALAAAGGAVLTASYSSTLRNALAAAALRLAGVTVCEGRPLCEGAALAAALAAAGVRGVAVVTDAQAGVFVRRADAVLLGADAVSARGASNKVGSRLLALAAADAGVPVYACADTSKIGVGAPVASLVGLPRSSSGGGSGGEEEEDEEEEEEMSAEEVLAGWPEATRAVVAEANQQQQQQQGPTTPAVSVRNVYFERVPLRLLTGGVVCETGVLSAADVEAAAAARREQCIRAFGLATLEHPPPLEEQEEEEEGGVGGAGLPTPPQ